MTAGSGIVHSERSPDEDRTKASKLSAIQTWLALPDGREEMDPAFEHVPEDALPVIEGHHARARVIMGRLWGQSAPVTTHANTIYADISLQPGGAAPIDADADDRPGNLAGGAPDMAHMALWPMTLFLLLTTLRAHHHR